MLNRIGQVIALVVVLAGASQAHAQAGGARETIKIIQSSESVAFLPYVTALTMGYFKDAGLDVTVIKTDSGSKVAAAVAGGTADVGMISTSVTLFSRNEGVDFVILAPLAKQYTTGVVYSAEWAARQGITAASSYKAKLAAMKGGRFATPGGSAGEHLIRFLAIEAGLDPDRDITIVPMGSDMAVYQAVLERGRVDGFALSAPAPEIAVRDQKAVYIFNLAIGEVKGLEGFLYTVAVSRAGWLKDNPAKANMLLQALARSVSAIRDEKTSAEISEKVRKQYYEFVDPALFNKIWEQAKRFVPVTMEVRPDEVLKVVDFTNRFTEGKKIDPSVVEGSFYIPK